MLPTRWTPGCWMRIPAAKRAPFGADPEELNGGRAGAAGRVRAGWTSGAAVSHGVVRDRHSGAVVDGERRTGDAGDREPVERHVRIAGQRDAGVDDRRTAGRGLDGD